MHCCSCYYLQAAFETITVLLAVMPRTKGGQAQRSSVPPSSGDCFPRSCPLHQRNEVSLFMEQISKVNSLPQAKHEIPVWRPFPSSLLTATKRWERTVHLVLSARAERGKAGAPLFFHGSFPGGLPPSWQHPGDPRDSQELQPRASAFDLSILTSEQPCCHASQSSPLEIRKRRRSLIKYFFSWVFVHPETGPCGVSASWPRRSPLVSRAGSWITG